MKEIIKMLKEDKVLRLTVVVTLAIVVFVVGSWLISPMDIIVDIYCTTSNILSNDPRSTNIWVH